MSGDFVHEWGRDTGPASPTPGSSGVEASPVDTSCPRLADGVELIGPVTDSGFAETQWLVSRQGQFIQVSELLYGVAEQANGTQSVDDLAAAVTDAMPYTVTAEHVRRILETKLAPLGLVATNEATGTQPSRPSASSGPLRVAGRITTIGPETLESVTGVLQHLFRPWVAMPLLFAIMAAHAWLYFGQGMAGAIVALIQQPLLVLPLFAIIVLAGVFHEFGHAAALRYGGGRCRSMGFGFYLIYPALFTDTSDAYRLGRRARVRTDLGGFYFHQLFALVLVGVSAMTGQVVLLLAALMIDLEMLRQLLFPFVRFDGYWLLADLTGIPDLYTHFTAIARGRLNGQSDGDVPTLRPWPRRVFAVYAAVSVPVLAGLFVMFAVRAPEFMRMMWDSAQRQVDVAAAALDNRDALGLLLPALEALLLALPLVGATYLIFNLARMVGRLRRSLRAARPVPPDGDGPLSREKPEVSFS